VRRILVALLISLGLVTALPSAASANPIYEAFCVDEDPPQGPGFTVCTPDW
jgi:hypothetical protein